MDVTTFTFSATMLALTLLVICMTSTPMICDGVSVDLPRTTHPRSMWQAKRENALMIAIFRTRDVFFENDKIAAEHLGEKISERIRIERGERKVYIQADARARWGRVGEVIDQVRGAGNPEVGFLADQRQQ